MSSRPAWAKVKGSKECLSFPGVLQCPSLFLLLIPWVFMHSICHRQDPKGVYHLNRCAAYGQVFNNCASQLDPRVASLILRQVKNSPWVLMTLKLRES